MHDHSPPRPAFTLTKVVLVVVLIAWALALLVPASIPRGFLQRRYQEEDGTAHPYVLFVPESYRAEQPYPVLVFLHGMTNHGDPTAVGLGPAIRQKREVFPFFVLFPIDEGAWAGDSPGVHRVVKILDQVERDYRIDDSRIFLTGLSAGGSGTWSLAAKYPERWAALVPVAATASPTLAETVHQIPCWAFHGGIDTKPPIENARAMMAALRALGAQPRLTELPGVDHNVWYQAYALPELYEWLREQRRP